MYLDALFVLHRNEVNKIKSLDVEKRFQYIVGLSEDQGFADHLINVGDFGCADASFFQLLLSEKMGLTHLDYNKDTSLYEDCSFCLSLIEPPILSILFKQIQMKSKEDVEKAICEYDSNVCSVLYTNIERYKELVNLIQEAYQKEAQLLLIYRKS